MSEKVQKVGVHGTPGPDADVAKTLDFWVGHLIVPTGLLAQWSESRGGT